MMSLPVGHVFQASKHKMHMSMESRQNTHFYGYSPEECNLAEVTSHLISKLDRLQVDFRMWNLKDQSKIMFVFNLLELFS